MARLRPDQSSISLLREVTDLVIGDNNDEREEGKTPNTERSAAEFFMRKALMALGEVEDS